MQQRTFFFDSFYSICRGSDAKQRQFDFYSSGQEYLFYDGGLTPEGNVDEYMQDVLTALYYVRTLPLKVGVEYILDTRSGDLSWPLTVRVLRKETVRTNLGRFSCFVIEPIINSTKRCICRIFKR
jgi:hypothetical protein